MKNDLHTQFITFCDYSMMSQENKLSIIGIFDEVRVQEFPGGLASAALVAIIQGKPSTSYKLTAKGMKGKTEVFPPLELNIITGITGASNITINLKNISFPEEGVYEFVILNGTKEIGKTTLKVIQVQPENQGIKYKLPN